eukprot:269091-Prymnesium_polylepis.1
MICTWLLHVNTRGSRLRGSQCMHLVLPLSRVPSVFRNVFTPAHPSRRTFPFNHSNIKCATPDAGAQASKQGNRPGAGLTRPTCTAVGNQASKKRVKHGGRT